MRRKCTAGMSSRSSDVSGRRNATSSVCAATGRTTSYTGSPLTLVPMRLTSGVYADTVRRKRTQLQWRTFLRLDSVISS